MMFWVIAIVAAVPLSPFPTPADGLPSVQRRWTDGRLVEVTQPQGFRIGLIDSGLLAEMNRNRWAPKTPDGRFDADSVRQLWVGPRYAMAFDRDGRLRFALFRYSVPVDTSRDALPAWSSTRLHRRTDVLARLERWRLEAAKRDRYGNIFAWKGSDGRVQARLRHQPARDEMLLLLKY